MVRIYVIRHSETEPNTRFECLGRDNVPLNEKGLCQAQELSQKLPNSADKIYCSPLLRAQDTIKPYLDMHPNIPIELSDAFTERDFGDFEHMTFAEIEQKMPKVYKEWQDNYIEYVIKNGESLLDVWNRITPFLDSICSENDGKTIFLMTHLCTARLIIARLLGLDVYKSRCFTMKNACYAVIDYDNNTHSGVLKYLNI